MTTGDCLGPDVPTESQPLSSKRLGRHGIHALGARGQGQGQFPQQSEGLVANPVDHKATLSLYITLRIGRQLQKRHRCSGISMLSLINTTFPQYPRTLHIQRLRYSASIKW